MHAAAGLEFHFAVRVSDRDHARPGAHLDISLLAEIFGCVDDQLAGLADASFDEIRQPAGPIGNGGAFLQDHDVQAGIDAPRARRRAQAAATPPMTTSAIGGYSSFIFFTKSRISKVLSLRSG